MAKRPFDSQLPIAEGFVREDLRLLAFLKSKERIADVRDVLLGQLTVLLAEILPQRLE